MSTTEPRRLVLRNELAELERLAPWIESWGPDRVSFATPLAVPLFVEEVVANVIMYGAPEGSSLEISVELERVGGMLLARIEDDGREFDPTQAPPPVMASSLPGAKPAKFACHLV